MSLTYDAIMAMVEKTTGQLSTELQALADVRTLDEWVESGRGLSAPETWPAGGWVIYTFTVEGRVRHLGATIALARHAAAEWVRGQK